MASGIVLTVAQMRDALRVAGGTVRPEATHDLFETLMANPKDVASVVAVVGAEATNVINVALQANDPNGVAMAQAVTLPWYLAADAAGQTIGTAHTSVPAIGADGLLIAELAGLSGLLTFEADGDADIDFTDTGAKTVYLVFVLPDGTLSISGAITHA